MRLVIKKSKKIKFTNSVFNLFTLTNTQVLSSNFYLGRDIKGFAAGDFEKKTTRDSSKTIMRKAIDYHLGNKQLNIRKYLSKK